MSDMPATRGEELLIQRAVFGLDNDEEAELRSLVAEGEVDDDSSLEIAAGAVAVLFAEDRGPMPEHLRRSLEERAAQFANSPRRRASGDTPRPPARVGGGSTGRAPDRSPSRAPASPVAPGGANEPDVVARVTGAGTNNPRWLPWGIAAAIGLVAILGWMRPANTPEPEPFGTPVAQARQALIQQGVEPIEWTPWAMGEDAPPELEGVEGDVVWDDETQSGYMRFVGLPQNDPSQMQYQLWIIDGRYGEDAINQRVSGGVFNSAAADGKAGELIIPIDPALPIGDAKHFAVTIERPGGVWVSDMSRRVVIAPPLGE